MVIFARMIQKLRPFCNLTPCKPSTEEGQVNPGSHKVKFLNRYFWIKRCASEPDWSQDFKTMSFLILSDAKKCSKSHFEKWRHQRIWFLGYMFAKNRYISLKFGMPDTQALFYNMQKSVLLFWILEKLYKKSFFKTFWMKKSFLNNKREESERTLYSTSFGAFNLHTAFNLHFWWFFKHLSIFDQKWHDIGQVNWYYSKILEKTFQTFCVNT